MFKMALSWRVAASLSPPPKVTNSFFVPEDAQCSATYEKNNFPIFENIFVQQNYNFSKTLTSATQ